MSDKQTPSGPQFHADRPREQEAVRTTIVGGRPPGSGQSVGDIPRGIEVLVKKAAVDADFKTLLLERRAAAAEEIGLQLEPAEALMLAAAPREQLEAVIAQTHVPEEHRRVFLGKVAAAMLAVLGVAAATIALTATAGQRARSTKGIQPDRPPERPKRIEPSAGQPADRMLDYPRVCPEKLSDRPNEKPKSGEDKRE
jgi:hypothetical protein